MSNVINAIYCAYWQDHRRVFSKTHEAHEANTWRIILYSKLDIGNCHQNDHHNISRLAERLQNLTRQYIKRKEFDCDCDNDYICVCLWSDCDGKARLGQSWVVGWPVAQSEYWSVGFILDIITPFFSVINTKHKINSHLVHNHQANAGQYKFNWNIDPKKGQEDISWIKSSHSNLMMTN